MQEVNKQKQELFPLHQRNMGYKDYWRFTIIGEKRLLHHVCQLNSRVFLIGFPLGRANSHLAIEIINRKFREVVIF